MSLMQHEESGFTSKLYATLVIMLIGVALSACDTTSAISNSELNDAVEPGPEDQISTIATDSKALQNHLTTGRNGDDFESYWQCMVESSDNNSPLPLRLFADGTGFGGETEVNWKPTDASSISMTSDVGVITVEDIELLSVNALFDRFVGNDTAGFTIDCQWSGRSRYENKTENLEDDQSLTSNLTDGNEESTFYSCATTLPDGSSVGRSLVLNIDRSGLMDDQPISWYVDQNNDLLMSSTNTFEITVFSRLLFPTESRRNFTAETLGLPILCEKN